MRDVTALNWDVMGEEVRIELILASLGEAFEMEHTDEDKIGKLQAILRVKDGEPLGQSLTEEDEETPDDELSDIKLVDRMIDFHYGNMV